MPSIDAQLKKMMGVLKAAGEFYARIDGINEILNSTIVKSSEARKVTGDYSLLDDSGNIYNPISTKTTRKTVEEFWNNWTTQVGASKRKQAKKWPGSLRISEGDTSSGFPAKGKPVQLSHGKPFKAKVAWVYMRDLQSVQEINKRIIAPLRKQLSCKVGG